MQDYDTSPSLRNPFRSNDAQHQPRNRYPSCLCQNANCNVILCPLNPHFDIRSWIRVTAQYFSYKHWNLWKWLDFRLKRGLFLLFNSTLCSYFLAQVQVLWTLNKINPVDFALVLVSHSDNNNIHTVEVFFKLLF